MFRHPFRWYTGLPLLLSLLIATGVFLAACGTKPPKTVTIGVIILGSILEPVLGEFKEGMTELGYAEGENITYIYEGPVRSIDKLEGAVQRLLEADVDLILSIGTPATLVTKQMTAGTDLPVVFAPVFDPLGAEIVPDLRHPGGNLTGIMLGKLAEERGLQWLLKVAPNVKNIYIAYNPEDQAAASALVLVKEAAVIFDIDLILQEAHNDDEITTAIETIPESADAIFILPDNLVLSRLDDIVAASLHRRLPLLVPREEREGTGALIVFGPSVTDIGQKAARLADQILQGVSPADLPVETSEPVLTINLRTAEAIGLDIPSNILEQADGIYR